MEPTDVVIVSNDGMKPIVGKLAPNQWYEIKPGKSRMMAYKDACLVFGNPNESGQMGERQRQFERVMALYGAFDPHADKHLIPSIRVEDQEGNRIYMLIEDRDGSKAAQILAPNTGDLDDQQLSKLEQLRDEINAILTGKVAPKKQAQLVNPSDNELNQFIPTGAMPGDVGADPNLDPTLFPDGDPQANVLPGPAAEGVVPRTE